MNNTADWNNYYGIYLVSSESNTITNNNATNNYNGMRLYSSSRNTITNNTASNNYDGIYLYYSSRNTITNNTASNNYDGIYLYYSSTNTIANNTASNNYDGIHLYSSDKNTITNNIASNTWDGIWLDSSERNTITNNTASKNRYGIWLFGASSTNTITNNTASNNEIGIRLDSSDRNTITNNTASSNSYYGIYVSSSESNTIYHNNFINNIKQAYENTGTNYWNAKYPTGGNYWSDYNGRDNYSGPDQNISGPDGIGDTSYTNIGGSGVQDNYPLMDAVDFTPPDIRITSPYDGTILNTSSITIYWNGTDSVSGIKHYEIRIDSGNWRDVELNILHNFAALSDGPHTVDVKAVDNASNENTASVTFTVDATAPEVTIDSPSDGAIFNFTNVTVSWTGSDATSGIDHYEIRMDSGNWTSVGLNRTYNFTGLSEGSHTVDVKAVDNASNENTTSVNFTVDTTPPTVASHSPTGKNVSVDSVITVTFSEEMNKSTVKVEINSLNGSITWNNNTATFTPLQNMSYDTNYTVNVTGSDLAGNSMDESAWSFTTTDIGTIVGIITDKDGNPVAGATVTLDSGETATTDENGHFEIQAHAGNHTLTISKDGYKTDTVNASLDSGEVNEVQIPPLATSHENNGPLWLWILLIIIVLALIGFMVARRKKTPSVPVETEENTEASVEETEETEESSSSTTEEISPPPTEDTEETKL